MTLGTFQLRRANSGSGTLSERSAKRGGAASDDWRAPARASGRGAYFFLPELLLLELLLLPLELLFELELFLEPPELDLVGMTLSSLRRDSTFGPWASSPSRANMLLLQRLSSAKYVWHSSGASVRSRQANYGVPLLFSSNKSDT